MLHTIGVGLTPSGTTKCFLLRSAWLGETLRLLTGRLIAIWGKVRILGTEQKTFHLLVVYGLLFFPVTEVEAGLSPAEGANCSERDYEMGKCGFESYCITTGFVSSSG